MSVLSVFANETAFREILDPQKYTCHMVVQMAPNVCTVLETPVSTESNRTGTNILVVKGIAHTRLKEFKCKGVTKWRVEGWRVVYVIELGTVGTVPV